MAKEKRESPEFASQNKMRTINPDLFSRIESSFDATIKKIGHNNEALEKTCLPPLKELQDSLCELHQLEQEYIHELSDQKSFYASLFESEMKYRQLFESSRDFLFLIYAKDLSVIDQNICAKERFGEVTYINASFFIPGPSGKTAWKHVINITLEEGECAGEAFFSVADNDDIRLSLRLQRLDLNDEIVILVAGRELSNSLDREEKMMRAQKLETLGMLASGVAHDFNNVLSGITGSVSLIKYQLQNNEPVTEDDLYQFIDILETSSARAQNIIKQLLSLSKKDKIAHTYVNVQEAIESVVQVCRNSFDKSIVIQVDYPEEGLIIAGNRSKIEQILLNLCINASHAMTIMRPDDDQFGGILTLSIKKEKRDTEDVCVVMVTDTGVGMSKRVQTQIFDPFFSTKDRQLGTGLGLSMVYTIMKKMHGSIDIDSALGKGSCFRLSFPLVEAKNVESQKQSVLKHEVDNFIGRVLLVDDEEMLRKTTARMLTNFGLNVIEAKNGEECIDIFIQENKDIDLVLLDMMMPGIGGDEVYLVISEINPDIPVVMISGYVQRDRFERIRQKGISGFLSKPFTIDELRTAIKPYFSNE